MLRKLWSSHYWEMGKGWICLTEIWSSHYWEMNWKFCGKSGRLTIGKRIDFFAKNLVVSLLGNGLIVCEKSGRLTIRKMKELLRKSGRRTIGKLIEMFAKNLVVSLLGNLLIFCEESGRLTIGKLIENSLADDPAMIPQWSRNDPAMILYSGHEKLRILIK